MEDLKKIVEDIWDELDGAKHYAEMALKLRGASGGHAQVYADMSRQELTHYDRLVNMAHSHVEAHRESNPDHYRIMKTVWDWEWDKMSDKAAKITAMLSMVK